MLPFEKKWLTQKKEMHAFLGRVALMENDGNRDKHPCLSDRMEVEISDVFSLKKKPPPIIKHLSKLKLESKTKSANASSSHHERLLHKGKNQS